MNSPYSPTQYKTPVKDSNFFKKKSGLERRLSFQGIHSCSNMTRSQQIQKLHKALEDIIPLVVRRIKLIHSQTINNTDISLMTQENTALTNLEMIFREIKKTDDYPFKEDLEKEIETNTHLMIQCLTQQAKNSSLFCLKIALLLTFSSLILPGFAALLVASLSGSFALASIIFYFKPNSSLSNELKKINELNQSIRLNEEEELPKDTKSLSA